MERKDTTHSGYQLTELTYGSVQELWVNAPPQPVAGMEACLGELEQLLHERCAAVVHQSLFGSGGHGLDSGPVTHLRETEDPPGPRLGLQLHAVSGVEVQRVFHRGVGVGSFFEHEGVRVCRLGGLVPASRQSRPAQTTEVLGALDAGLRSAGMDLSCLGRTWFYLDHIHDWYDTFNRTRSGFYRDRGVLDRLIPASTGIGGGNPAGAALSAGAFAARGPGVTLCTVDSVHQGEATAYGSSFSRAVEVGLGRYRLLLVSGTASIDASGLTVHHDDVAAQIGLTMEIVAALLASRGMGWETCVRGVAYFRHLADAPLFERFCRDRGVPPVPVVVTTNDICRDDLLFELEVDAVAS